MPRQQAVRDRKPKRRLERLETRITREQKRMIERAAALRGTTVTDFVLASAQQAATETIEEWKVLRLGEEDTKWFVNVLLNPPAPSSAAEAALRRSKQSG